MAAERASDTNCLAKCRTSNWLSQTSHRCDIDRPSQESFEPDLEPHEVEQRASWLERHEKVYVAIWPLLTPRDGAKNSDIVGAPFLRRLQDDLAHPQQLIL
jgi:hypothetical protein